MSVQDQNDPARQGGSTGVDDVPHGVSENRVPRRGLASIAATDPVACLTSAHCDSSTPGWWRRTATVALEVRRPTFDRCPATASRRPCPPSGWSLIDDAALIGCVGSCSSSATSSCHGSPGRACTACQPDDRATSTFWTSSSTKTTFERSLCPRRRRSDAISKNLASCFWWPTSAE